MTPKFGIGDKVRVVNYGSIMIVHPNMQEYVPKSAKPLGCWRYDTDSGLVGKEGIVCEVSTPQDRPQYAIEGIPQKHAWYDEEQLELITKNNATQ
jgi:hypothetical protein